MSTTVYPVNVSCPIEAAFDYVAEVERHPEWASDEMRVERLTPSELGLGTRYRTTGHSEVWNTDNVAEVEVTRYERPSAFEIVCRDAHGEFRHLFTFARGADGRVQVERHYTVPDVVSAEAKQRVEALMVTVIEPARKAAMSNLGRRLEEIAAAAG